MPLANIFLTFVNLQHVISICDIIINFLSLSHSEEFILCIEFTILQYSKEKEVEKKTCLSIENSCGANILNKI